MRLTKYFFKSTYAKELTWHDGFADAVIKRLEEAGCSHAWQYYDYFVTEWETAYEAEMKEVASWYRQQCEQEWERKVRKCNGKKGGETERIQEEIKLLKQKKMLLEKRLAG